MQDIGFKNITSKGLRTGTRWVFTGTV